MSENERCSFLCKSRFRYLSHESVCAVYRTFTYYYNIDQIAFVVQQNRNELFIVGWQNDPHPKERVKKEIVYILNKFLPESYDREIFSRKSSIVFDHIVDQAMNGYKLVA